MGRSIVFVVGAGASKDFGESMPIGEQLALQIENFLASQMRPRGQSTRAQLNPDSELMSAIGYGGPTEVAANIIRNGIHGHDSIDDLLHAWSTSQNQRLDAGVQDTLVKVAKYCIARAILKAEMQSELRSSVPSPGGPPPNLGSLRGSWLGMVVRWINNSASVLDPAEKLKDVAFIVFNYDRCVERFLLLEIQALANLDEKTALSILDEIPIVHPHGSLGCIAAKSPREPQIIQFGADTRFARAAADHIRTYTEEEQNAENLRRLETLIEGAKKIVMMGFSYHPQNMKLLIDHGLHGQQQLWGACLSPDPRRISAFHNMFPKQAKFLENLGCSEFILRNRYNLFD